MATRPRRQVLDKPRGSKPRRRQLTAKGRHCRRAPAIAHQRVAVSTFAEILGSQFNRTTVWRAVRSMVPGFGITGKFGPRSRALAGNQRLERGQPVVVVGVAEVGIACGLRVADLLRQRIGPFIPSEQSALVQLDDQREGMRLPGCAKDRFIRRAARQSG